jgi:hypothetical protein
MSASPPSPLPAHLRPVDVEIPATWTPEQALAIFELLDEIREKVWFRYGSRLQDLLREQRRSSGVDHKSDFATSPDRPDSYREWKTMRRKRRRAVSDGQSARKSDPLDSVHCG